MKREVLKRLGNLEIKVEKNEREQGILSRDEAAMLTNRNGIYELFCRVRVPR